MTKADIISKIVETTGLPKKDVAATAEAFMSEIRTCMADNKENVYLRGFGTFTIKHRTRRPHVTSRRTPHWLLTHTTFPLSSLQRVLSSE